MITRLHSILRRHEVWIVLSVIVLANAVFVTSVVGGLLPDSVYGFGRFGVIAVVLFGMVFLSRGWDGVVGILKPMLVWRRSPWLYFVAVVWTLAFCLLVLLAKGIFTGDHLTLAALQPGFEQATQPRMMLTLLVSSFIGEMLWVSYGIRQLSRKFTYFISGLIVGAVWAAWWLPMALHNFGIIPDLPLAALLINQCGIALTCAFVYFHTRSGLLVLLMQVMFNATVLVFPVTPTGGGAGTYWAFALTYFSAAVALFFALGPRPMLGISRFVKNVKEQGMGDLHAPLLTARWAPPEDNDDSRS